MRARTLTIFLFLIASSLAAGYYYLQHRNHNHLQEWRFFHPSESLEEAMNDSPEEHAKKHQDPTYVCPMHPQIVRKAPGNCPICGMDLVEKTIQPITKNPEIALPAQTIQNYGIKLTDVQQGRLWKFIQTYGTVVYNENKISHIHAKASGWLQQVRIKETGQTIAQGDVIGQFYSPEINRAQAAFLAATGSASETARIQLRLLGLDETTIDKIEAAKKPLFTVPLLAEATGVVNTLNIREGMFITPSSEILQITDPSALWVIAQVPEHQIPWIKEGLDAEIVIPALKHKKLETTISFIAPEIDAITRTLSVRLSVPQNLPSLKPNTFAEVNIYAGPKLDVTYIPNSALIEVSNETRVIKSLGEGKFKAVRVKTGMRTNSHTEIMEGLTVGDQIVESGLFLIDSESNLQKAINNLE